MPTPAAQVLLDRLHGPLDHKIAYASSKQAERDLDRRSELTPRFKDSDRRAADDAGMSWQGPR